MNEPDDNDFSTRLAGLVYRQLAVEAREVSTRSQERLCALRHRFPELGELQEDCPLDRRRAEDGEPGQRGHPGP